MFPPMRLKPFAAAGLCAILAAAMLLLPVLPLAAQEAPKFEAGGPLVPEQRRPSMSIVQALVLGVVEGVTEYLPVSSTGHLTVVGRLLGLGKTPEGKSALDAYTICIQAGAILAVLWISFGRIRQMLAGLVGRNRDGLRLLANLAIAAVPAGIIGLLLEERIKSRLF